MQEYCNNAVG